MIKYFKHFSNFPLLPEKYIKEGIDAEYELKLNPNLYWADSTFRQTDFFKILDDQFGQCYVKYYLNPPNSFYNWHVDLNRNCTINWVIKTNKEARTFYREPIPETMPTNRPPAMYQITEVDYTFLRPTLLNATYEHGVVNNFNDTRIILSLSIFKPTAYESVLDFLQKLNINEY